MKTLHLKSLSEISQVASPENKVFITVDSPALMVFTDFAQHHPFDLKQSIDAREALYLMQMAHVRMKLVVDEAGDFAGLVSTDELTEQEIIKRHAAGLDVKALTVADFMRRKSQLQAIEYADLAQACIGDVLSLLCDEAVQHCLVLDSHAEHIRGVISSSDMARMLKLPVDVSMPSNFVQVCQAVKRSTAH